MNAGLSAARTTIALVMLMALPAAQTGIPKSTEMNPGRVTPGDGNFVVIGCVSRDGEGTPPTFVITDTRSKPPARYRLEGDADLLRLHVGHTVEVGGPIMPASGARGGTAAAIPSFKVESLTYLSTTCVNLH
ncbi:MAG TPA: hypothetical protein VKE96_01570 [Vicinamibacterales bacterium]|nr:hypothetical protein [Vicinamibacterales bacterium]